MYRIYYFFFFFYIFTPSTLVMTGKSSSQDRQYRLPRGPGASYFVLFPSRAQKLDYYFSDFVSARFGFFYHITYILFIALVATRITSPTTHPYTVSPPPQLDGDGQSRLPPLQRCTPSYRVGTRVFFSRRCTRVILVDTECICHSTKIRRTTLYNT